ncbi:MAG: hypothetical protein DWC04_04640 [Candidatus Poseidoniales archaeon]|nr:MAG: hypothetical protein DWC04_04640 [Candidatus Poseidoniales archaeon]
MYLEICVGLFIGWIFFFELIIKRKLAPKLEASKKEYEVEQEFLSAVGLLRKCEICGQEEHTTEEHHSRHRDRESLFDDFKD